MTTWRAVRDQGEALPAEQQAELNAHIFKSRRSSHPDPESGREERFYHRRLDHWEEYFLAGTASSEISPLTAISRITVIGLKMNSPA
jgi:hypothetical protein